MTSVHKIGVSENEYRKTHKWSWWCQTCGTQDGLNKEYACRGGAKADALEHVIAKLVEHIDGIEKRIELLTPVHPGDLVRMNLDPGPMEGVITRIEDGQLSVRVDNSHGFGIWTCRREHVELVEAGKERAI